MGVVRRSTFWALTAALVIVAGGLAIGGMPAQAAPESSPMTSEPEGAPSSQWQSELFFHRSDGLYRTYDPSTGAVLPSPMTSGSDWPQTGSWQFSMLEIWNPFGGGDTGAWAYRILAYDPGGPMYVQFDPITWENSGFDGAMQNLVANEPGWAVVTAYKGGPNGSAVLTYKADGSYQLRAIQYGYPGPPTDPYLDPAYQSGSWTSGWTSIVPLDLNGDGDDEFLFYRKSDGLFRYYDMRIDGTLPKPMAFGNYTTGWDSITAVDLDGDLQDEIMFYRADGLFRYYEIHSDGTLPKPLLAGSNYTKGWSSISRFEACSPDPSLCG